MATAPKQSKPSETHTAYTTVKEAFNAVQKLKHFRGFDYEKLQAVYCMKYGSNNIARLQDLLSKIPSSIPENKRLQLLSELSGMDTEMVEEVFEKFSPHVLDAPLADCLVFAPTQTKCLECEASLEIHNRIIDVRFFGLQGVEMRKKLSTRCSRVSCRINYHLSTFGKKGEFRWFDTPTDVIEATDGVIIHKKLFQQYCSFHMHSYTSFTAFAESYNTFHGLAAKTGLNYKIVSSMYYLGEVEEEMRRLEWVSTPFSDTNLDPIMAAIEEERHASLYSHQCTDYCKQRGCGKLYVIDGIWKIVFTVCAMRTENIVNGLPLLKYPDVCTNEPVSNEAFCKEHKAAMQNICPVKLKDFLKLKKGEMPKKADTDNILEEHPQLKKVGEPIVSTQGASRIIRDHTKPVTQILDMCDDTMPDKTPPCNKETGERANLNMKSKGYVFIVSAGGYIQTFSPIYRAESPSQVFLIILSFLYLLLLNEDENNFGSYWLAYDNMCNVMRLKVARMTDLPLPGKFKDMWNKVNKMVDGLHISNHKREICKTTLHPDRFKEAYPECVHINTMAAEQLFAYIGRFQKQICSLPKRRQLFMLHRLCIRRNAYTQKCHQEKRDPYLPKKKLKKTSDN